MLPTNVVGIVLYSLMLGGLAGFVAGQATREPAVALWAGGAIAVVVAVFSWRRRGR